MGVTQVTVAIRNPGDPEKSWEGLFLVDTGSIDCLVPGNHPAAGSEHDTDSPDGLDPFDLGPKWFPGWRVEQFEVYDHLGDLTQGAPWLRGLEKRLARRNPDQGCHFCLALIKPEN